MSQSKNIVLIIEDESVLALLYKMILENKGFNVAGIEESGENAVKLVKELNPDIILLDISLSGRLNGIETSELLHRQYAHIPVIFISGNIDEKVKEAALKTHPFRFIEKPVKSDLLVETVMLARESISGLCSP